MDTDCADIVVRLAITPMPMSVADNDGTAPTRPLAKLVTPKPTILAPFCILFNVPLLLLRFHLPLFIPTVPAICPTGLALILNLLPACQTCYLRPFLFLQTYSGAPLPSTLE
jgi:hypothetical protein